MVDNDLHLHSTSPISEAQCYLSPVYTCYVHLSPLTPVRWLAHTGLNSWDAGVQHQVSTVLVFSKTQNFLIMFLVVKGGAVQPFLSSISTKTHLCEKTSLIALILFQHGTPVCGCLSTNWDKTWKIWNKSFWCASMELVGFPYSILMLTQWRHWSATLHTQQQKVAN